MQDILKTFIYYLKQGFSFLKKMELALDEIMLPNSFKYCDNLEHFKKIGNCNAFQLLI